jgi:signal transduction histidine kinase
MLGRVAGVSGATAIAAVAVSVALHGSAAPPALLGALAIALVYAACIGAPAAIVFGLLWPRVRPRAPLLQLVLGASLTLGVLLMGSAAAGLLLLRRGIYEAESFWPVFRAGVVVSIAFAAVWSAGAFVYDRLHARLDAAHRALHREESERRRAQGLAIEAQLSSLEARIRPHFLFNALNAVLALIPNDPRRAERTLERLAALLRFSLDAHAGAEHTLGNELSLVADYLEIEKARFAERLRWRLDVPPGLARFAVPPFSVQTLVENAVKHAVTGRRSGGEVVVEARRERSAVLIEVLDDGPGFGEDALRSGHGLSDLRERLRALHGSAGTLDIITRPRGACVRMAVPAAENDGV